MAVRNILVVDDELEVREVIRAILQHAGYHVTCAEHGGEALKAMAVKSFDVVLTDLLMPDKDGVETIRDIRKTQPGLKIIAMSGGGHVAKENYLKMAQVFGAHALLPKPFSREDLLKAIEIVLAVPGPGGGKD